VSKREKKRADYQTQSSIRATCNVDERQALPENKYKFKLKATRSTFNESKNKIFLFIFSK
jgi:hypothetical protein